MALEMASTPQEFASKIARLEIALESRQQRYSRVLSQTKVFVYKKNELEKRLADMRKLAREHDYALEKNEANMNGEIPDATSIEGSARGTRMERETATLKWAVRTRAEIQRAQRDFEQCEYTEEQDLI